jgi:anti-anti-sigma factor
MTSRPANELVVDIQWIGSAAVVHMRGSAGMSEADRLKEQLDEIAEQPVTVICVDLSELEFICSGSLGALLSAHKKAKPHHGKVRLVHPRPLVLRVLETTRLTDLFEVFDDLDRAMEL